VREFADAESAGHALRELVRAGDVVLLKASRSSRIERVGEILRGAVTTSGADTPRAGEGHRS
jgi:UDP-N-acetylmuramyl pentapeptide synthase